MIAMILKYKKVSGHSELDKMLFWIECRNYIGVRVRENIKYAFSKEDYFRLLSEEFSEDFVKILKTEISAEIRCN